MNLARKLLPLVSYAKNFVIQFAPPNVSDKDIQDSNIPYSNYQIIKKSVPVSYSLSHHEFIAILHQLTNGVLLSQVVKTILISFSRVRVMATT